MPNDDVLIADLFPADDITARFVLSMAMARNDLEQALRDVVDSVTKNRPDFSYRVRLTMGHLVEALDALRLYRDDQDVRRLIARLDGDARSALKLAAGTLQKAGPKVLDRVRDNTFHYASPNPAYRPTSDELLGYALTTLGDRRAELHWSKHENHITFVFAEDAALALAFGEDADPIVVSEFARDGAMAFIRWANALVDFYLDSKNAGPGAPEPVE